MLACARFGREEDFFAVIFESLADPGFAHAVPVTLGCVEIADAGFPSEADCFHPAIFGLVRSPQPIPAADGQDSDRVVGAARTRG